MRQKITRAIIAFLIILILTILGTEVGLRLFDPLGVNVFAHDIALHNSLAEPDDSGYRLPTGTWSWLSADFTVLEDATRYVPDSDLDSDCDIAVIGDSLTFGQGVSDEDTYVNLLAGSINARWKNTGRQGYGIDNIRRLQEAYPADGYIYLVVGNDSSLLDEVPEGIHPPDSALATYLLVVPPILARRQGRNVIPPDVDYFMDTLAEMDHDNLLLIGFEDTVLGQTAIDEYGGLLISRYTTRISWVDTHPDANGHRQMYTAMLDKVSQFVERICANNQ